MEQDKSYSQPPTARELQPAETIEVYKTPDQSLGFEVMNSDAIVQVELGGLRYSGQDNAESDTLSILRPDRKDPAFGDLVTRAKVEDVPIGDELMVVSNGSGAVIGASFLSPTGRTVVGREGNTRWFSFGGVTQENSKPTWTPFKDSVSRRHITVEDKGTTFGITAATGHAHTAVRSSSVVEKLVIAESDLETQNDRLTASGMGIAKAMRRVVRRS